MRLFLRYLFIVATLFLLPVVKATPLQKGQETPDIKSQQQSAPERQSASVQSTTNPILTMAPVITATVALIFGALAWRFNERSIRRVARQDHIRMLIEVDNSLIDHPELWRIYDDEYTNILPPKDANPWEHPRRKALIYLMLNMFEAEFDFHRHLKLRNLNWRTASDKEYHDAWRRFIKDFFARSAEAQEVWNTSRSFYSKAFADFIDGLLSSTKAESRANQASATTL